MLPSLSCKKVIKALEKYGYVIVRQKGSHIRMHSITKTPVTIPNHNPIAKGTLRKILRDADLGVKDFLKLL
jgi:predicted RNA binding protein YcfA (HicA-like mRNA interferase family)